MEKTKSKVEGWRKMGIAGAAIGALSVNNGINFRIAVIIGVIAIVGIVCQGVLDWKNGKAEPPMDTNLHE